MSTQKINSPDKILIDIDAQHQNLVDMVDPDFYTNKHLAKKHIDFLRSDSSVSLSGDAINN